MGTNKSQYPCTCTFCWYRSSVHVVDHSWRFVAHLDQLTIISQSKQFGLLRNRTWRFKLIVSAVTVITLFSQWQPKWCENIFMPSVTCSILRNWTSTHSRTTETKDDIMHSWTVFTNDETSVGSTRSRGLIVKHINSTLFVVFQTRQRLNRWMEEKINKRLSSTWRRFYEETKKGDQEVWRSQWQSHGRRLNNVTRSGGGDQAEMVGNRCVETTGSQGGVSPRYLKQKEMWKNRNKVQNKRSSGLWHVSCFNL